MIAAEKSGLRVTIPLSARGSEVESVFKPDHILAFLARHQDVQSAIAVHVDEADLVCRLVFMDPVFGEAAPAVVFKPGQNPRVLGTDREIGAAIAIDVADRQTVRSDVSGIDLVRLPLRRFEPDHALSMPAAGEKIGLSVSIQIDDLNVGGAFLVPGDQVFGPRFGDVGRMLPPREPVSIGSGFRRAGDIDPSVAIDVADAEVMAESGSIAIGEDESLPAGSIPRVLGNSKPSDGVRKVAVIPAACSQQFGAPIAVEISEREPVDAIDSAFREVVDHVEGPRFGERVLRLLEPEDETRPVLSADIVQPSVAIDIEAEALDHANAGAQQDGAPIGRAEERDLAVVLNIPADHIHAAGASEVPGGCALIAKSLSDHVSDPRLRQLVPENSNFGTTDSGDIRQTVAIGIGDSNLCRARQRGNGADADPRPVTGALADDRGPTDEQLVATVVIEIAPTDDPGAWRSCRYRLTNPGGSGDRSRARLGSLLGIGRNDGLTLHGCWAAVDNAVSNAIHESELLRVRRPACLFRGRTAQEFSAETDFLGRAATERRAHRDEQEELRHGFKLSTKRPETTTSEGGCHVKHQHSHRISTDRGRIKRLRTDQSIGSGRRREGQFRRLDSRRNGDTPQQGNYSDPDGPVRRVGPILISESRPGRVYAQCGIQGIQDAGNRQCDAAYG